MRGVKNEVDDELDFCLVVMGNGEEKRLRHE